MPTQTSIQQSEWVEGTLEDFVDTFIVPQRDKPKTFGGSVPWCRIEDFDGKFLSKSKTEKCVTDEQIESMPLRVYPKGTVIVSCSAYLGKCAIIERPLVTNQTFIGLVPSDKLDSEFLYYSMLAKEKELNSMATGATIKYLSKKKFKSLKFSAPPVEEQQRIVRILDEAFNNIENQTRRTQQKMNTGGGLLHSYIHKIFSEGGENWTEKTIEETCKLISGQHILAADYNTLGKGIGYLTGPADFGIENPVIKRWTEKPKVTAIQGDILITVKGSGVGKINRLSEDEVAISRQLMAIRSNGEIDGKFLFYFISIQYDMFQGLATGAAIPGISRSDVLKLQIPYPTLNEQIRIVKRFDDFTNQSQEFSKICDVEIASLSELKQSILQEAINGAL